MRRDDYAEVVDRALAEDLGEAGDVTSQAVIPAGADATGSIVARRAGVVAGLDVAAYVYEKLDPDVRFRPLVRDGDRVQAGAIIATVEGPARSVLVGERTALNFLGRMSGVATATAELVKAVAGTGAKISDTRKTMPGLRALDKYAVRMGGGINHRFGLYDAVMIKDNHIATVGGIKKAVEADRAEVGPEMMVVVEVEDLEQLAEILETGADRVLLDNMDPETLATAVAQVGDALVTEASGGITPDNIRAVAEAGVDIISVGWITHSPPQLDLALDLDAV